MQDIIVYGATSFVGQIVTRYLCESLGHTSAIKLAIAGRNPKKLEELAQSLPESWASIDILVADATDEIALCKMVEQGRVIISTVGPYAHYGELLVKACATAGVDYCDLTGEVPWMHRMISKYGEIARESGSRLLHCCGFDSVPSDLGVYHLQKRSEADHGEPCIDISMRLEDAKGGVSGGTIASLVNVIDEAGDTKVRRMLKDPYSLCPDEGKPTVRQEDLNLPRFEPLFNGWAGPFVMAAINTKVVHRSNALMDYGYGKAFRYCEGLLFGPGPVGRLKINAATIALALTMLLCRVRFSRNLLLDYIFPKPGQGPSARVQQQGYYKLKFIGKTASGHILTSRVTGDADPGYGSTAKIISEVALCLLTTPKQPLGGFWTPASLLGERLIERLEAKAGLSFESV